MVSVDPGAVPTLTGPKNSDRDFKYVPFMAPHMFTPEYLEVNYPTCSTIFLRSPLPQPNRTEIPSPHPPILHQLVFEWYSAIKRRKVNKPDYSPVYIAGIPVNLKPKFKSIVRADKERVKAEKSGKEYVISKPIKIIRRRTLRPRYKPKRDRYALKYG